MCDDPPVLRLDEELRRGSDDLEGGAAVEVEEVGGGIHGAEMAVDIEGMQVRGAGDAVGGNGLDDVAARDVGFERCNVRAVAGAAEVGRVRLIGGDGRLRRERDVRGEQGSDCGLEDGGGGGVGGGEEGVRVLGRDFDDGSGSGGRDVEVRYHFDELVEVVEGDDGVEEHEEGFGNLQDILHGASGARFEVSDAVITHVANCTAGEGRQPETRNGSFAVSGEFGGEDGEGVFLGAVAGARFDHLPRVFEQRE